MSRTGRRGNIGRSTDDATPALALEAIDRFVRVLARTGLSAGELASAFRKACQRIPDALVRRGRRESREMIDAPHALTLWFSDPDFLDIHGTPLALSLRGRGRSLAALVRRVDPSLDPTAVLGYLLKANALQRQGARYIPRSRALLIRGTGAPVHARNLRPLLGMLRNLEHNALPAHEARAWFDRLVENPRIPVRALAQIDARLDRLGTDFARSMDALMARAERACRGDEPTVRLGIGVFRYEAEPQAPDATLQVRRRPQRRKPGTGRT